MPAAALPFIIQGLPLQGLALSPGRQERHFPAMAPNPGSSLTPARKLIPFKLAARLRGISLQGSPHWPQAPSPPRSGSSFPLLRLRRRRRPPASPLFQASLADPFPLRASSLPSGVKSPAAGRAESSHPRRPEIGIDRPGKARWVLILATPRHPTSERRAARAGGL